MKIIINKCFGGFGLSHEAIMSYAYRKGIKIYPAIRDDWNKPPKPLVEDTVEHDGSIEYYTTSDFQESSYFSYYDIERNDPILVDIVEELGDGANGNFAELAVVEIPDDVEWSIDEYDGMESVHENHRSWS